MKPTLPLLIAMIFAGAANAQNQLPPPDAPAVEAFVKAIDDNFYIGSNPSPFYDHVINLAEQYYLTGAPLPKGNTNLDNIISGDAQELSYFNYYWVSDPNHSLSDPAGIYFGNTPGIDTPRITASDIIYETSNYDFTTKLGPSLNGKTGDLSRRVYAPEIDPASAMSAITLLFGGLFVLRGGRTARRQYRDGVGQLTQGYTSRRFD
jgi:hypothetical protein